MTSQTFPNGQDISGNLINLTPNGAFTVNLDELNYTETEIPETDSFYLCDLWRKKQIGSPGFQVQYLKEGGIRFVGKANGKAVTFINLGTRIKFIAPFIGEWGAFPKTRDPKTDRPGHYISGIVTAKIADNSSPVQIRLNTRNREFPSANQSTPVIYSTDSRISAKNGYGESKDLFDVIQVREIKEFFDPSINGFAEASFTIIASENAYIDVTILNFRELFGAYRRPPVFMTKNQFMEMLDVQYINSFLGLPNGLETSLNHELLDNLLGGSTLGGHFHFTGSQWTILQGGPLSDAATLHTHLNLETKHEPFSFDRSTNITLATNVASHSYSLSAALSPGILLDRILAADDEDAVNTDRFYTLCSSLDGDFTNYFNNEGFNREYVNLRAALVFTINHGVTTPGSLIIPNFQSKSSPGAPSTARREPIELLLVRASDPNSGGFYTFSYDVASFTKGIGHKIDNQTGGIGVHRITTLTYYFNPVIVPKSSIGSNLSAYCTAFTFNYTISNPGSTAIAVLNFSLF